MSRVRLRVRLIGVCVCVYICLCVCVRVVYPLCTHCCVWILNFRLTACLQVTCHSESCRSSQCPRVMMCSRNLCSLSSLLCHLHTAPHVSVPCFASEAFSGDELRLSLFIVAHLTSHATEEINTAETPHRHPHHQRRQRQRRRHSWEDPVPAGRPTILHLPVPRPVPFLISTAPPDGTVPALCLPSTEPGVIYGLT